jgi:hypothetical protein
MVPNPEKTAHYGEVAAGTGERRPRSGYARAKIKLDRTYQGNAALEADNAQLQSDYVELERAFTELKSLNASLADDLRRSRPVSGSPSARSIFGGLMHGR